MSKLTRSINWGLLRNDVLIFGVAPLSVAIALLGMGVYLSRECAHLGLTDKAAVNSSFCQWMSDLIFQQE